MSDIKRFRHQGVHSILVFSPFYNSEYPSLSHEIEVSFMLDDSRQYMRHWLSREQALELRDSLNASYPELLEQK